MDTHYKVLVASEKLIPAAADLTGLSEEEIQRHWDKAKKKGDLCTFQVPGEFPLTKRCAVCSTLARMEAEDCKTCGDIYTRT